MSEYPSEWSVRSLGEIAERVRRTSTDQNLDVLTISSTEGWVDQKRKWARDMAGKSIEKYTLLQQGEFSYNRGNSKTYPQGCVFRLESWDRALVPNVYHSFSITSPDIDDTYLKHFFSAGGLNDQLRSVITSSVRDNGLLNITADTFFASEIPVPPLPEQKKIAEILSGIDEEITGVSKFIQRKRLLRESLLKQMIPHPSTFCDGLPPRGWTLAAIEDICSLITYGFTNPMPTTEEGIYMVTAKDVRDGKIDTTTARFTSIEAYETLLTDKSRPKRNDILVTKDGTLGRTAVVGEETICINQSVALLRPRDEQDSQFLQLLLSSPQYQETMIEESGGSAVKHIYITTLAKMRIAIPLSAEAREEVANCFDALNKSIYLFAKKHDCLTNLKKAIASDLLSGRKRVSD
jgi:type I restriction enzyme, S subunit